MADEAVRPTPGGSMQVTTFWLSDPNEIARPANQLLLQGGIGIQPLTYPDGRVTEPRPTTEVYLTFGHVMPPAFQSQEEAVAAAAAGAMPPVPIVPVARLTMSIERLRAIKDSIGIFLDGLDEQQNS